jgi:hypothetical protein
MPEVSTAAYRWTLVLFAVVAAALVVWFQRHVEPFVTGTLVIGGTISAWGLWQLGWSFYKDAGGGDGEDLTRRLLGNRRAWRALLFGALVVAALHLLTSSVYLRFEGAGPGESEFRVQVLEGDQVFMGPYTLHAGDVVGFPRFPTWKPRALRFQIIEPRKYAEEPRPLPLWGALDMKVPGSFHDKAFYNVVFVPDMALYSELPPRRFKGGLRHYLAVTFNGQTVKLPDFTQQLVVTGAPEQDLPDKYTVRRDELVREEVTDYYLQAAVEDHATVIATLLNAEPARLGSAEFTSGAKLGVEVGTWTTGASGREEKKTFACELLVPTDGVMHTLIIGPTTGECQ